MRFLGYNLADEASLPTEPPSPSSTRRWSNFVEEATKAGVIVATGGIAPTSQGARITLKDGQYTVVDGPFAEAKELVGGWAAWSAGTWPRLLSGRGGSWACSAKARSASGPSRGKEQRRPSVVESVVCRRRSDHCYRGGFSD